MTWEWPTYIYLWVAGIAGGAYFAAFLADRFSGGRHKRLLRAAIISGVPLVLLGSLLLVLDLGEPYRGWHLFARFRLLSPMSMGSWILFVWAIIGIVLIALWWIESVEANLLSIEAPIINLVRAFSPAREVLAWIAFVLAALLIAYTGVLLSATNQPLWASTFLLPALFVASAISTGTALLLLLLSTGMSKAIDATLFGIEEPVSAEAVETLGKAGAVLGGVELVVLIGYLVWLGAFATPDATQAVAILLSGPLSLFFWGGVVLIGLLLPLGFELATLREKAKPLGVAIIASSSLVLLGGLVLRAVVVIAGQM